MTDLEIKHLKMIRMISKTKTITKAADKLFISQPALSQQLINIENRIGTKLFIRNGKNMILTKVGEKFLESAHVILNELEKTEREVAQVVNGERGEFKIGVRCIFCFKWIPLLVKQFQGRYPNVDIRIGHTQQAEEDLISKTYDIAITSIPLDNMKITHTQLFEDEILCVMPADHPLSHRKYLNIEDFEGADYLATDENAGLIFKESGIHLRSFTTIPYPETIVAMVEAGLGITFFPQFYISPYTLTKDIHTCQCSSKKHMLRWNANYLKGETHPSYQDEFIKTIISHTIVE
ncbi:MAG: LysR family transcriptional regulator [Desulfobacteraceae bacterium]|jgi:LysR family transcriptional regulator for metE and metH